MEHRKLVTEALGTALLVILAVGTATSSSGSSWPGLDLRRGGRHCHGIRVRAAGLAYTFGPISGAHVNPAVTLGFVVSRRMPLVEAIGYWVAQFIGGIVGAVVLWAIVRRSQLLPGGHGLGADGWGNLSMVGTWTGPAPSPSRSSSRSCSCSSCRRHQPIGVSRLCRLAIGLALASVHLVGIPLTGTSVNPARSLGPALVVGGTALRQVWLFIVAPLIGGALAALAYRYFTPDDAPKVSEAVLEDREVGRTSGTP